MTITAGTTVLFDPDARLPYTWDWAPWLTDRGDTIASATVTGSGGIVVDTHTNDTTTVTATLTYTPSEGKPRAVCHIVTAAGYEDDRTIPFAVSDR